MITAQFGDGYTQLQADGLNNVYEVWEVTIPGQPSDVADALEISLSQYALAPFYWHPMNLPPTKKYRIEGGIQRTYHSGNNAAIVTNPSTFAAVFENPYVGYSDLSFKLVQVFDDG